MWRIPEFVLQKGGLYYNEQEAGAREDYGIRFFFLENLQINSRSFSCLKIPAA